MRKTLLLILVLFCCSTLFLSAQKSGFENSSTELSLLKEKEPEIKIFPVPVVNNRFTVTSDMPFKYVRMTNIIGQEITRQRWAYPVSRKEIEFKGTEKGIYLVTIELEDKRKIVRKILVENGR